MTRVLEHDLTCLACQGPRACARELGWKDSNLHPPGQSRRARHGTPQCFRELSENRTQPRGLRDRCSALELTAHAS